MATKKPTTTAKKAAEKPKTTTAKKTVKTTAKAVATPVKPDMVGTEKQPKKGIFAEFFDKKYEGNDSILTIFKQPKFYGVLAGEILGVLLLTLAIFSVSFLNGGIFNINAYSVFVLVAIFVAIYKISGAHLNPLVTAGMMATRRISVIRGVFYIIAQIVGAWLGWLIMNAFLIGGGNNSSIEMPKIAEVAEGNFWIVTLIEFLGATIIGFFFARALSYKRSAFTFAAVVVGGICLAVTVGYIVSAGFFGLQSNFIFNPALALMQQIFPVAGTDFGEIFGGICSALATYVLFPAVGGIVGFYLSDFASKLSSEEA